jgi:serine/threonine-protein kinase HipA
MVAAASKIMRFGDETAIVLERYDRRRVGEDLVRIHQEDLCQALGRHPSQKYQNEGGPTPQEIVTLFRDVMPTKAAEDAVSRFVDALIWNCLIAGTDAHAKNYSLLLLGSDIALAPLYDIASILPYGRHERELRFAMKIGGDYRVYPHRNMWPKAAAELKVKADALEHRVMDLAARAPDAFADAASSPDVLTLGSELPERLTDLVAGRAARCVGVLETARAAATS